jgi:hypothetical protein
MAAPRAARRVKVSWRAARTDVTAIVTPTSTRAHDPLSTVAALVKTMVAKIMPVEARATRVTLPKGLTAQVFIEEMDAVIEAGIGIRANPLDGSDDLCDVYIKYQSKNRSILRSGESGQHSRQVTVQRREVVSALLYENRGPAETGQHRSCSAEPVGSDGER